MTRTRIDVEFTSKGATLRGWLFPAEGEGPHPAVVMAHGFSAVKEMVLDDYAAAFAAAGFTTLAYDHFGFGDSDGEPRQSPSAPVQLQGFRDAIAWMQGRDDVDAARVGVWGTSFTGGMAITLSSEDLGLACAVGQVPNLDSSHNATPAGAVATIMAALEAADDTALVPAVTDTADGNGIMFKDDAYGWFTETAAKSAPNWRNELHIGGLVESGAHSPMDALGHVRVPLLLLVAPDDTLTPPGDAVDVARASNNVTVTEIPGGHFDAYMSGFEQSCELAIDWFRKHL